MKDGFWHMQHEFLGSAPRDIVKGILEDDKKNYKKAEAILQEFLAVHPYRPEEILEMGLVYTDWGKNEKAIEYLKRAQSIWEDADPEYKPAIKVREKLAELEN